MDEAAISHNLDLDEIYDGLLNRLFSQYLWSTPVLCSANTQTPSRMRIITAQESETVSRRTRAGLLARHPLSAELASGGLGEEYARGRAESHKQERRFV